MFVTWIHAVLFEDLARGALSIPDCFDFGKGNGCQRELRLIHIRLFTCVYEEAMVVEGQVSLDQFDVFLGVEVEVVFHNDISILIDPWPDLREVIFKRPW